jgi:chromosome segregation ATPase
MPAAVFAQVGELQHQLQGAQQEQLQLRGQVLQLQQQLKLLGGNLNGHLSLAQGSVVTELHQLLQQRDTAVAASGARLQGFAWQLDRICEGYNAQLAAEQQERARLGTEAAQARLLSIARGRQVAALQADLDEVQQQLTHAQAAAAKGQSLQQEQQEDLRQQLLEAQAAAAEAREAAAAAKQAKVAAEGGTQALRQQVAELQTALTDKQLQVEWLEGKVADLTDAGRPQPLVSGVRVQPCNPSLKVTLEMCVLETTCQPCTLLQHAVPEVGRHQFLGDRSAALWWV